MSFSWDPVWRPISPSVPFGFVSELVNSLSILWNIPAHDTGMPVCSVLLHGRGHAVQEEVTRCFNMQTMTKSHEAEATPSFCGARRTRSPELRPYGPLCQPRATVGPTPEQAASSSPQKDSPRVSFLKQRDASLQGKSIYDIHFLMMAGYDSHTGKN